MPNPTFLRRGPPGRSSIIMNPARKRGEGKVWAGTLPHPIPTTPPLESPCGTLLPPPLVWSLPGPSDRSGPPILGRARAPSSRSSRTPKAAPIALYQRVDRVDPRRAAHSAGELRVGRFRGSECRQGSTGILEIHWRTRGHRRDRCTSCRTCADGSVLPPPSGQAARSWPSTNVRAGAWQNRPKNGRAGSSSDAEHWSRELPGHALGHA